jgi:hypothetical protein
LRRVNAAADEFAFTDYLKKHKFLSKVACARSSLQQRFRLSFFHSHYESEISESAAPNELRIPRRVESIPINEGIASRTIEKIVNSSKPTERRSRYTDIRVFFT